MISSVFSTNSSLVETHNNQNSGYPLSQQPSDRITHVATSRLSSNQECCPPAQDVSAQKGLSTTEKSFMCSDNLESSGNYPHIFYNPSCTLKEVRERLLERAQKYHADKIPADTTYKDVKITLYVGRDYRKIVLTEEKDDNTPMKEIVKQYPYCWSSFQGVKVTFPVNGSQDCHPITQDARAQHDLSTREKSFMCSDNLESSGNYPHIFYDPSCTLKEVRVRLLERAQKYHADKIPADLTYKDVKITLYVGRDYRKVVLTKVKNDNTSMREIVKRYPFCWNSFGGVKVTFPVKDPS